MENESETATSRDRNSINYIYIYSAHASLLRIHVFVDRKKKKKRLQYACANSTFDQMTMNDQIEDTGKIIVTTIKKKNKGVGKLSIKLTTRIGVTIS
jgi:hypothetical protein